MFFLTSQYSQHIISKFDVPFACKIEISGYSFATKKTCFCKRFPRQRHLRFKSAGRRVGNSRDGFKQRSYEEITDSRIYWAEDFEI